jgi:hypothetical protein
MRRAGRDPIDFVAALVVVLKIVHDGWLLAMFRKVGPPREHALTGVTAPATMQSR